MKKQKSNFIGDVLNLAIGVLIARSIGILTVPIIARLFGPEAFGLQALFISITGVISLLANLRYETTIMLPESDEEAANLFILSIIFPVLLSIFCFLVLLFIREPILKLFHASALDNIIWLVPVCVFIIGLTKALEHWNSRMRKYTQQSIATVINALVNKTGKLAFGFMEFKSVSVLISFTVLGHVAGVIYQSIKTIKSERNILNTRTIKFKKMLTGMKRYKDFPLYGSLSRIFIAATQNLPVILLAYFFNHQIVGFFSLGRQALAIPSLFAGQALGRVFFQRIARAKHEGRIGTVVEAFFKRMVSLGIFPFLIITLLGKDIVYYIVGPSWSEAGVFIQFMGGWIFLNFIYSSISTIMGVLEAQKEAFFINIILAFFRFVPLLIGCLSGNSRLAIFLLGLIGSISYIFAIMWLLLKSGIGVKKYLLILSQFLLLSMPFIAFIYIIRYVIIMKAVHFFTLSAIAAIIYYLVILIRDHSLRAQILSQARFLHSWIKV